MPNTGPPRGYGVQGNLLFLLMGTWEHLIFIMGIKGTYEIILGNTGHFRISSSKIFLYLKIKSPIITTISVSERPALRPRTADCDHNEQINENSDNEMLIYEWRQFTSHRAFCRFLRVMAATNLEMKVLVPVTAGP